MRGFRIDAIKVVTKSRQLRDRATHPLETAFLQCLPGNFKQILGGDQLETQLPASEDIGPAQETIPAEEDDEGLRLDRAAARRLTELPQRPSRRRSPRP